jgi:hypothetical protein
MNWFIRAAAEHRLGDAQRDDLRVGDPSPCVGGLGRQEIVNGAENNGQQQIEVGVHRGPLGRRLALQSTADFDLPAYEPFFNRPGPPPIRGTTHLADRAAAVAADQAAPLTRSTYAGVYRAFCAFVGPDAGVDALGRGSVRAYRQSLEVAGRSPATIAKHLSALRRLADELGADDVRRVRGASVARGRPRHLTGEQYARLSKMPDRRSTAGKRDLALLHLLGVAPSSARNPTLSVCRH